MSKYFQVGNRVLWNPSNGVAELFIRTAEAFASVEGVPTGIGAEAADEHEVDPDVFTVFVDALVRRYLASTHAILRSLLEGFTATALVLVHRAGRSVSALNDPPLPDRRDVSVAAAGITSLGDARRLRDLVAQHAHAMPD